MNRRFVIVLAVAVAAFGAAYALLAAGPSPRSAAAVVEPPPKVDVDQVLVAAEDLPMGAVVAEGALAWQPWPKAAVSELMIARSEAADAVHEMKGSMTRAAFLRGEPMRRDKLVKAGAGGFMSAILPSGMRAVAIKIDNGGDSSAGGFILPNDRVDVVRLARDDDATKARGVEVVTAQTILANVRVLAIGQNVEEQNGKKVVAGANATLELDPDQVNLIVLAQHAGSGNLHLALRSLADSGGPSETLTDGSGDRKTGLTVIRFGAAQQAIR
jgi:pilus assembly protein CpaB